MLNTIILLKNLTFKRLKIGNNEVDKFSVGSDEEIIRKSRKLKS